MATTQRVRLDGRITPHPSSEGVGRAPSPTLLLFLCLFASQAALVVLAPILPQVARELGVSTAFAAQLRAISGVAAGVTAVAMSNLARRLGLRDLLRIGLTGIAASSLASALAPSFAILALAQVGVGASVAVIVSAGPAAASAWASPGSRARLLSWTLSGQPTAWIVGLPLVGVVSGLGWRYAWIAVPFASAVLALAAIRSRPEDAPSPSDGDVRALARRPAVVAWAIGELFAYTAWTGTVIFSGALLVESYGASPPVAGIVLGGAAVTYLPGTFLARRWTGPTARRALIVLALVSAAGVGVFGAIRPVLWVSVVTFAALVFIAGARTMVGSAFGLHVGPDRRVAVMSVRAAALQFGYLLGAAIGGIAVASGGYGVLGATLGTMFVLATVPHVLTHHSLRRRRVRRSLLSFEDVPGRLRAFERSHVGLRPIRIGHIGGSVTARTTSTGGSGRGGRA